ncbi:MAG TPA: hypothetical protein VF334_22995 [Polyangia bacterium]
MSRAAATALLTLAAAASLAAAAGCTDSCPSNCSPPVFDLTMGRMDDLSAPQDLATNAAAIVMIGAGGGNAFSPSTAMIKAGQSVTWRWVTGFHSVVSDSAPRAFPDSPAQASGQYTATFATAGSFAYHCAIDGATGTIVVQ